ncbi:MAG: glutamate-1-semialdehyde 2,1-aminomutase [Acidobacteria bacterium]|nr:glutamate-1-semialdehyde 2,1-aminomutase [Acidobacteriota bacterium]MBU4495280.1 glutamate-1-semialdehyde 2,1-aminomutase [Acidobacteriota bacterium]MCG2815198.1 glutamate-1-semialdehyde 2,1-aminomutase [Candidatus Aminicenantes bacterium]
MKRNSKNSEALFFKASNLIPGGVNSPVRSFQQVGGRPVYFEKASGAEFVDADGNQYTDYCQSWGPLILGHARLEVVEAVQKAARSGLSFGACHRGEIEFAELVLSAFPGFNRIRVMSSGTEAVMTALRLARGVTGRDLVVKFIGGYHGHSDGMLVKAGSGLATQAVASSHGIPGTIAKTTLVAPLDDEEAVYALFDKFGERIAAVVIEPLPANNGLLIQRNNFLQLLRELSAKHGSLLIFDEVISGFRLHFGAYWQMIDVVPDLFTLGKIIGGGMPVGAVVGTERILDNLAPLGKVYQAGTLSGNPVALAAGRATLEVLLKDSPYEYLEKLGRRFVNRLQESGLPYARAQLLGSIIWLYLDKGEFPRQSSDISNPAMKRFVQIYGGLLERGQYLPPSSYEVLFLSSAHTSENVDILANTLVDQIKEKLS